MPIPALNKRECICRTAEGVAAQLRCRSLAHALNVCRPASQSYLVLNSQREYGQFERVAKVYKSAQLSTSPFRTNHDHVPNSRRVSWLAWWAAAVTTTSKPSKFVSNSAAVRHLTPRLRFPSITRSLLYITLFETFLSFLLDSQRAARFLSALHRCGKPARGS